ncbi:MAG: LytTR family DNA-binding domain-containing protein [Oscillospiraceae bacterium]|nr:LytTR family DNA-binding domain-containing protein [Oscillospiraceae bacterium]
MRIAICDDEPVCIQALCELIRDYAFENNCELQCDRFLSGESLLHTDEKYDLYFLDYQMDGIDGLETARRLRGEKQSHAAIIFLTAYREIVYDAFGVRAFRFLVKPVEKEKLYDALDSLFRSSAMFARLCLRRDGSNDILSTKEILYIEACKKSVLIRLVHDTREYPYLLSDIEKFMPSDIFFRPHRSYIVNFAFVDRDDGKTITMKNGEKIPISKRQISEYRKKRNDYIWNFKG